MKVTTDTPMNTTNKISQIKAVLPVIGIKLHPTETSVGVGVGAISEGWVGVTVLVGARVVGVSVVIVGVNVGVGVGRRYMFSKRN